MNQRGLRPRPDQVSARSAGLAYLAGPMLRLRGAAVPVSSAREKPLARASSSSSASAAFFCRS